MPEVLFRLNSKGFIENNFTEVVLVQLLERPFLVLLCFLVEYICPFQPSLILPHSILSTAFFQVCLYWIDVQTSSQSFITTSKRIGEGNGTPLQYSCLENPMDGGAWQAAVHVVAKSQTQLSDFTFTFHCHALEKEMATHSSVLAWRIPGTVGPGGLPSMGSHRVGHD